MVVRGEAASQVTRQAPTRGPLGVGGAAGYPTLTSLRNERTVLGGSSNRP